jgi:NAD(P)-dependent dehydrogenase (short-subunit alcohol dehydrogenase family)
MPSPISTGVWTGISGPGGITVNTVHPGPTDTDMNPDDGPVSKIVFPGMAIGRYGKPGDIASAVADLKSIHHRRRSGCRWRFYRLTFSNNGKD